MSLFSTLKDIGSSIIGRLMGGEESTYDALSYSSIIQDRQKFLQSGGRASSEFNTYDFPDLTFFKILFHFNNHDDTNTGYNTGLLAPAWFNYTDEELADPSDSKFNEKLWDDPSAWAYLMLNGEDERAANLKSFCELLSNINTEAPWYFQAIGGLSSCLNRKISENDELKFDDTDKKITITCLPDPYDNRIGTLLDLYRSIIWSNTKKCVILPSNLRKFDMTIITFSVPITGLHTPIKTPEITDALGSVGDALGLNKPTGVYGTINRNRPGGEYLTNFKSFELTDCEFDYNSSASAWDAFDNAAGNERTFTIGISVGDCYESRYNEFMRHEISDLIAIDAYATSAPSDASGSLGDRDTSLVPTLLDSTDLGDKYTDRKLTSSDNATFGENVTNQLIGWGTSVLSTKVNKLVLGNLFGFSLSNIGTQASRLASGNIVSTLKTVKSYVQGNYNGYGSDPSGRNIFSDTQDNGNYQTITKTKNLYKNSTTSSLGRARSVARSR